MNPNGGEMLHPDQMPIWARLRLIDRNTPHRRVLWWQRISDHAIIYHVNYTTGRILTRR